MGDESGRCGRHGGWGLLTRVAGVGDVIGSTEKGFLGGPEVI